MNDCIVQISFVIKGSKIEEFGYLPNDIPLNKMRDILYTMYQATEIKLNEDNLLNTAKELIKVE